MDFKKKRKGFSGFLDRFASDQSRFEDYYVDFLLNNINNIQDWNLSVFPNGFRGENIAIPRILIQNFPKKFTNNNPPIIGKITNYSTLNIPELLEKLIYFSLLSKKEVEETILELKPKLEGENADPLLSIVEWSTLFNEISDMFNFLTEESGEYGDLLPDVGCLLDKDLLELSEDKIYDVFKAFNLMLGYSLIYGSFTSAEINDKIDEFLGLNAPDKDPRKTGFFSGFESPKYLYSLEDLVPSNEILISEIIAINIKRGYFTKIEAERFLTELDSGPESLLDFITMVLIHNGQTLPQSKNNIVLLKEQLNEISFNWDTHWQLTKMIMEFSSSNFLDKMKLLPLIRSKIHVLFYSKT